MSKPNPNVVVKVVEALAEADGAATTELDYRLSDYMDPDVLEKLSSMEDGIWELTFRVSDHHIRINHEGQVFVNGVKHESKVVQSN